MRRPRLFFHDGRTARLYAPAVPAGSQDNLLDGLLDKVREGRSGTAHVPPQLWYSDSGALFESGYAARKAINGLSEEEDLS
jgi:hypothetical protein